MPLWRHFLTNFILSYYYKSGAKSLVNFATHDVWKGNTWFGMAKSVTVLSFMYAAGSNSILATGAISAVDKNIGTNLTQTADDITQGINGFVENIPKMKPQDWWKATSEFLFAVAGTKGVVAVKNAYQGTKSLNVIVGAAKSGDRVFWLGGNVAKLLQKTLQK